MIIAISGKIGSGKDTVAKIINYILTGGEKTYVDIKGFLDYYDDGVDMYPYQNKKFAGKLKQMVSLVTGIPVEELEKEEVKTSYLSEEWNRLYWKDPEPVRDTDYRITTIHYHEDNETAFISYNGGKSEAEIFTHEILTERITVRQLLQEMGTDALRNVIHPDFHVNALFADYLDEYNPAIGNMQSNWIISDMRFPNELEAVKKREGITIRVERDRRCEECKSTIPEDQRKLCAWLTCPAKKEHPSETALDNATFDYTIYNNGTIEGLIEQVKVMLENYKII